MPARLGSTKTFSASPRSEASWLSAAQRAEIDRLFARPPKSPGYAVAMIKDGEFALRKGFGLANPDDGIPITPETSFHLASLSKQFTGAAVALLILKHKIALSDDCGATASKTEPLQAAS